jgi:hypothetical protein
LTFDRERGVVTVPLPDGSGKKTVKVVSDMDGFDGTGLIGEREERTLREVLK